MQQRHINLKAIACAAVLVIIIGFVNTARMNEQAAEAEKITSMIASDHPPGIDSSFFDYNEKPDVSAVVSKVRQVASTAPAPAAIVPPASPVKPASAQSAVVPAAPANVITADSYLVGNLATGKVYFEKDPTAVRPIASISKLISAIVITKDMQPDIQIPVASSSVTGYEQAGDVHPGETFSASDLLTGMLLISSNDAAMAFANDYGYPAFISSMNETAAAIGMSQTSFKDPSGLSSGNVSSANDLFKLAQHMYADDPGILAITKTPTFDLATTTTHDGHDFTNIDPFAYDPHYIGGKTGRSDAAGETMLSLFNLSVNGVDSPIVIIVLHSDQDARQTDSSILVGKMLGMIIGG
ncbi:MAG: serine hydrolase [Candidatus Pacebacteria bacterium]|nr:serine hydrolase [Candidatus Paceibacterota bacterium]